ncbi:hypothetical protein CMK13_05690 [Candidatus Poribacteria bacterium]|nr:hypothetical protein [Candidatus Poribacteria bacterium]OUT63862.1 MAG: hypothetical protein CBB75_05255 [bacterium TMED15]
MAQHLKVGFGLLLTLFFVAFPVQTAQDKLVIISPHWEGIEQEFNRGFESWYKEQTGRTIKMDWLDQGGTSSDIRFIEAEYKRLKDGINIDLLFGGGTDAFMKLAEMGFLEAYKLPEKQLMGLPTDMNGIPVYDSQYRWYGAALSSFGVMHNEALRTRLRLPRVSNWKDLTNPRLIGRVGAADPRESGSAHMIYEIILQGYGWQDGFSILTQLAGNVRGFSAGSNAIPKDVVAGQVIYGMAIDFYAYGAIAQQSDPNRIQYTLPPDATVIAPDSIAILKGAPNKKIAEMFVTYVMSKAGQKLWLLRDTDPEGPKIKGGLNRASVLPFLYDELGDRSVVSNPFESTLTPIQYDPVKGSSRTKVLNDLMGALLIDQHKELVKTWRAIHKSKNEDKRNTAISILCELPLTESEAVKLEEKFNDNVLRNKKLKEWSKFASNKYRRARKALK